MRDICGLRPRSRGQNVPRLDGLEPGEDVLWTRISLVVEEVIAVPTGSSGAQSIPSGPHVHRNDVDGHGVG